MRYGIVFLVAIQMMSLPAAAAAGDGDGFSAWAAGRSRELDGRWDRVTAAWIPANTGSADAAAEPVLGASAEPARALARGDSPSALSPPGIGPGWTHTHLRFTTYDDGLLLINSARRRAGAGRGVSRMSSPAQAAWGDFGGGRVPFDRTGRFTRTIHTKGRNFGSRLSAPLHGRITRGAVKGPASSLHGARRVRRSPTRGMW